MKPSKEDLVMWRETCLGSANITNWHVDDEQMEVSDPSNILSLLDLVEEQQKEIERLENAYNEQTCDFIDVCQQRDIALLALKAIKERAKGNALLPTIIERVDQAFAAMEKIE